MFCAPCISADVLGCYRLSLTWIAADRRAVLSSLLSPAFASVVPEQQQVQHANVYYLAQYRGAVSALQLVVAVPQLAVWTGAAERRATAVIGSFAAVTGFAGRPVTAVSGLAERPVSAVASGWHCQRCLPGGLSAQVSRRTDVKLSCGETTWN